MAAHYNGVPLFKGSLQWKNDLGLYVSLVLVMNIFGDVLFGLSSYYRSFNILWFLVSHIVVLGIRTCIEMYG